MPLSVRRIGDDRVEVLFDRPLDPTAGAGKALTEFSAGKEDMEVLLDEDGRAFGLQANPKSYILFLQSIKVSDATIQAFRAALDDSKKAVRARQREPRKPR